MIFSILPSMDNHEKKLLVPFVIKLFSGLSNVQAKVLNGQSENIQYQSLEER